MAQLGSHLNTNELPTEAEGAVPNQQNVPEKYRVHLQQQLKSSPTNDQKSSVNNEKQPKSPFLSPLPLCTQLHGLSPGQARICELFWDHMPAVGIGARHGIQECVNEFKHSRWNCTTPYSKISAPIQATRETAFTYAIIAAGVSHQVARACRLGQLTACGCSTAARPSGLSASWQWGGCGDNIDYGYEFSKNFIDIREKEYSWPIYSTEYGQALMNRWNNEVGRKLLKRRSAAPHCKCHGVSGSCSVRTCWQQLAPLRTLSHNLLAKYRSARRVKVNARGNLQVIPVQQPPPTVKLLGGNDKDTDPDGDAAAIASRLRRRNLSHQNTRNNRNSRTSRQRRSRTMGQYDLVYMDESPDYCEPDSQRGSLGTRGRECNRNGTGMDSCQMLCCGRGYDTSTYTETRKCNCRFEWCCKVVCDSCTHTTSTHICK